MARNQGQPLQTNAHRQLMVDLTEALRAYYRARPDVYVSSDLLMFYEEGKPEVFLVPDVFIALGVVKKAPK